MAQVDKGRPRPRAVYASTIQPGSYLMMAESGVGDAMALVCKVAPRVVYASIIQQGACQLHL
jgi:hypothetical protein